MPLTLTPVTLGPGGSVSKLYFLVDPDGKLLSNDACTSYDCPAVSPLSSKATVRVDAALLFLRHVCCRIGLVLHVNRAAARMGDVDRDRRSRLRNAIHADCGYAGRLWTRLLRVVVVLIDVAVEI